MRRSSLALCFALVVACAAHAQSSKRLEIQSQHWSVVADAAQQRIQISFGKLGTVVHDLQLWLLVDGQRTEASHWELGQQGQSVLTIRTMQPQSCWSFTIAGDTLLISTTSSSGLVTARADAPPARIPARLMDDEGPQVLWKGTNEAQEAYGGDDVASISHLPRSNPDVMYFALGTASVSPFHALFDRLTDTAIAFPESAAMERETADPATLDLSIPVNGNAYLRVVEDYYTQTLGVPDYVPYKDSSSPSAPVIWNSFNAYYGTVSQKDMVQSTDWLEKNLKPYGLEYVVLDAGYSQSLPGKGALWMDWDKAKFPQGPEWLAHYIHSKGFKAGVWIVPNTYAGTFDAHPDWYVYDKQGDPMRDYGTYVLDSSNPAVLTFLASMFHTFRGWGFDYYKFDGEHALPNSAPDVDRSRLYDASADPRQVYRHRMQVIRNAVGPSTFLEGCPAGRPLDGIGYFNSYSNGFDLYSNWDGMYSLFSAISANAFTNHIVAYVMPGEGLSMIPRMSVDEARKRRVPELIKTIEEREHPTAIGTTDAQARTMVSFVSLSGVAYPVADYLLDLPDARVDLLRKTLPTVPILPSDLFSRGHNITFTQFRDMKADDFIHNYPEIIDLKIGVLGERYDVVALTNWRSNATSRLLPFAQKLGLQDDAKYVVFDFWHQQPLGIFTKQMKVEIGPYDTRVLQIYPLLDRPQVVGTSRHITGSYSLRKLEWDGRNRTLHGVSQSIPGQRYTLWVHLPEGYAASTMRVAGDAKAVTPLDVKKYGEFVAVEFAGQQSPLQWSIAFPASSAKP